MADRNAVHWPHLYEKLSALEAIALKFFAQHVAPAERYETRMQRPLVGTADGSGNLTIDGGTPVIGKVWYLERISKHASAGTPTLAVNIGPKGTTDAAYRQDYSLASADDIADETNPIFVGSGEYVTLVWGAGSAGSVLSASLQIRVHRIGAVQPG